MEQGAPASAGPFDTNEAVAEFEHSRAAFASLVCPQTRLDLELCTVQEAERRVGTGLVPRADALNTRGKLSRPVGRTPWVLLRADLACAYPVVSGVPVLMVPEALTPGDRRRTVDLTEPRYAEAYEEMEYYGEVATEDARQITASQDVPGYAALLAAGQAKMDSFPHPRELWIDGVYDCAAQWDAYQHIAPVRGKVVMQLGGKGGHAVKFLLAGAAEAWVVTPMLEEALYARTLAEQLGVGDRLRCAAAVAEEMPLRSGSVDAIFSGACLHHMQTEMALPEIARVLREGGRFSAVDPWRAPLYAIGIRLVGKREPSVHCKPLTKERVAPVWSAFRKARVVQHGTLTRYPLIALSKFGIESPLNVVWYFNKVDDALCSVLPGMRRMGSSVAVLGSK